MQEKSIADILKKYWGFDSFRPMQEEIIQSVLHGCDTLALLPTGGGKSLCYQVPALAMEGTCLVVSPLIALMKDQVQRLRKLHIKAECITSDSSFNEQYNTMERCMQGQVKILYVSPERLRQQLFINHLKNTKVNLIAVDEAHCISQWGYDFRPSYLKIAAIRQYHPDVPVLALTATATPRVAEDIRRQLCFRPGEQTFVSSFVRPNLSYMAFREADKMGRLMRIARTTGGCGIVYVRSRRRTREVAQYLTSNGIPATFYHAGLTFQERNLSQRQWTQGEIPVMVATNAFGMGIDKPDVRFIVHLDIPDSIEAYFQEAGRAGRDGQKAYAVLLYDDSDLERLEKGFESSYPPPQQIANVYRALCNYFQLPIGSGEGCEFDFDLQAICNTYHFDLTEFYNILRLLEREGLLLIPELDDTRSTLCATVTRKELYRFQVEQHRYGDLMTTILRMYGGIFTAPVPISERDIARRTFMEEKRVENMLRHMKALGVVDYYPRHTKPWIVFTAPRIDAKDLYLNNIDYPQLQRNARERMEAMRRYTLSENGCRSQQLVAYFGEQAATPCGICDHCITQARAAAGKTLRQRILDALQERPLRADELQATLHLLDETELREQLRLLVDERKVSIDQQLQFFV